MRSIGRIAIVGMLVLTLATAAAPQRPQAGALAGYAADAARTQRDWEQKFRAIPLPANMKQYMERLAARPHHVGSPYDKDNAEWIAAKAKEWGFEGWVVVDPDAPGYGDKAFNFKGKPDRPSICGKLKPEYEDVARAAKALGLSPLAVRQAVDS